MPRVKSFRGRASQKSCMQEKRINDVIRMNDAIGPESFLGTAVAPYVQWRIVVFCHRLTECIRERGSHELAKSALMAGGLERNFASISLHRGIHAFIGHLFLSMICYFYSSSIPVLPMEFCRKPWRISPSAGNICENSRKERRNQLFISGLNRRGNEWESCQDQLFSRSDWRIGNPIGENEGRKMQGRKMQGCQRKWAKEKIFFSFPPRFLLRFYLLSFLGTGQEKLKPLEGKRERAQVMKNAWLDENRPSEREKWYFFSSPCE